MNFKVNFESKDLLEAFVITFDRAKELELLSE